MFITSILIAAVLAIPMLELAFNSTRWGLPSADQSHLSLPASGLLGVLVPFEVQPEWLVFVGVSIIYLACIAFVEVRSGAWYWLCVLLVSVLLSLGASTPFYSLISSLLPGAALLRVPPRWFFLGIFSIAILAGYGMDILASRERSDQANRRLRLLTTGFFLFVILLIAGALFLTPSPTQRHQVSVVLVLFIGFWAVMSILGRMKLNVMIVGWVVLVVLELVVVHRDILVYRDITAYRGYEWVESIESKARVFSPSYSLPQHVSTTYGLEMSDGVSPMQLKRYYEYMASATGFLSEGYSVTLPPFPSGDPSVPWGFDPNTTKLSKLNIATIISAYPAYSEDMVLKEEVDEIYIYELANTRPRAWIEREGGDWEPVDALSWSPNKIDILVRGPGKLVLSEISYPGWEVSVDGIDTAISTSDELLRSVDLSEGDHQVNFRFVPVSLIVGAILTLGAMVGLLWFCIRT